ncbi:MAG: biotin/lipoyl-containing protein [Anaerolineae bacterium]
MSVYYVTVRGKQYTVEVSDPHARPMRAIVDGEVVEVDVAPAPASTAALTSAPSPAPVAAPAPVVTPEVQPTPEIDEPLPDAVEEVKAPLPGTVVSIGVSVGERVTHGQELCVLEAMKMNNPIRANQAGVVTKIFVTVGQQVQHGTPLLMLGE